MLLLEVVERVVRDWLFCCLVREIPEEEMDAFSKLAKIPVQACVLRWKNMPKERVMKMDRIENVKYSDFTGQIMHYWEAESGVAGKCYPPKPFMQHLKLHHKGAGKEEVFFCIREDIPPGEIDFEIRFKPIE